MKAGVSTGPCGVVSTPARAAPLAARSSNENMSGEYSQRKRRRDAATFVRIVFGIVERRGTGDGAHATRPPAQASCQQSVAAPMPLQLAPGAGCSAIAPFLHSLNRLPCWASAPWGSKKRLDKGWGGSY